MLRVNLLEFPYISTVFYTAGQGVVTERRYGNDQQSAENHCGMFQKAYVLERRHFLQQYLDAKT